jgi:hypothetical protein
MHAVVKSLCPNDILTWPDWQPAEERDEYQWFTVDIGVPDSAGADQFQVLVASYRGLRARHPRQKFVGLMVDVFEPQVIEDTIRSFVSSIEGASWGTIAAQLQHTMRWEFANYRP